MKQDVKKILKIILVSLLFVIIFTYAFFESKDIIFGVKIKNVIIDGVPAQAYAKTPDDVVTITGNAKNAVILTLDDREISIDQAGNFSETIALFSGYNVIDIKAKDKFGKSDEKNYKIIH